MIRTVKSIIVLSVAVLSLCACGQQTEAPAASEQNPVTAVSAPLNMGAYRLTLPEGCTMQRQEDGSVSLLLEGTVIGGVMTISYPDADQISFTDTNNLTDDKLSRILDCIVPEDEPAPDHMFSSSNYGTLELCVVKDQHSELHYFFPKGDLFYDLWMQEGTLPTEKESALLSSFTLNS